MSAISGNSNIIIDHPREPLHLLSLRVMRQANSLTSKEAGNRSQAETLDSKVSPSRIYMRDLSESEFLSPSSISSNSIDNIYLGATFDSYLIVNNDSTFVARNIGIKAELQTSSQRLQLADTSSKPIPIAEPLKACEFVIRHEIKELGLHNLVCMVQYTTDEGVKRSFRKFYRFRVLNPFAVKTKVNNMGDGTVFLEVQIQNVAERLMYLEKMGFEPGDVFNYQDLNYVISDEEIEEKELVKVNGNFNEKINKESNIEDTENNEDQNNEDLNVKKEDFKSTKVSLEQESIFGENSYLNPQDIRQYLYMLTPKPEIDDKLGRTTNALGKLDIVWRSSHGETGRLQTSQLTRKPPALDEIELSVTSVPPLIELEVPFKLGCRIRNRTSSTLKVVITAVKTKMGSVLLSGPSVTNLGELSSDSFVEFSLEFFPLSPGLQRVGGLKVTDKNSGYTKEIDHFTDIFVLFSK
ncbi:1895_t:CDS:1 [Funneliformis caledonium]|uniref:1895_t:CDS:1 n=1 Tax=Funneliformis caledonium TaxID=1117310 RepID=A0A9N9G7L7_9GLOM|nr:1895_t:CDS:1 [Funneliformis caledonium]